LKPHDKDALLKRDPERFPAGIWQVVGNLAGRISRSLILIHFFSAASLTICGAAHLSSSAAAAASQSNKRIAKVKFPEGFLAFI